MITIREAARSERPALIPLLPLAEPSERALRWSLSHLSDTLYRMDDDGAVVGAASVRDVLMFRYELPSDS